MVLMGLALAAARTRCLCDYVLAKDIAFPTAHKGRRCQLGVISLPPRQPSHCCPTQMGGNSVVDCGPNKPYLCSEGHRLIASNRRVALSGMYRSFYATLCASNPTLCY